VQLCVKCPHDYAVSRPSIRETSRVALIEASDMSKILEWAPPSGTFSNRVSSLTPVSLDFLNGVFFNWFHCGNWDRHLHRHWRVGLR
jgi:hypothetical protein